MRRKGGNAVLAFNGNESLTDRYLWGPAVDQILADERFSPTASNQMPSSAGTVYFALGDNEWSVRDWITYGSLVDHIIYDSFGKIYSQSSTSVPFAFMHNGVFYDPATGLEYHSQSGTGVPGRWYNPAIQRWMSEDPTGLRYDSNPYRDVGNSPTNFIDPSGHQGALGGQEGLLGGNQGGGANSPDTIISADYALALHWQLEHPGEHLGWVDEAIAAYGGLSNEANKKYAADHNRNSRGKPGFDGPLTLEEAAATQPGYLHYLTHPGEMDGDLQVLAGLAWGAAGVGAGGLAGIGAAGLAGSAALGLGASDAGAATIASLTGATVGQTVGGAVGSIGGPDGRQIGAIGGGIVGGTGGNEPTPPDESSNLPTPDQAARDALNPNTGTPDNFPGPSDYAPPPPGIGPGPGRPLGPYAPPPPPWWPWHGAGSG